MRLNQQRQGELFIVSESILWALFPIVTIFSYNSLSPLFSLAGSTTFSIFLFALVVGFKKKWAELKNWNAFKDVLWATLIIGVGYYVLFFFSLKYTSAGNASIISLTAEIFFSFIFFHLWHKDYIPKSHIIGTILMATAAIIVLFPNTTALNKGDLLVLLAAFIAPFGNFFQQRARKKISSETIMFSRSIISAIIILGLAMTIDNPIKLIGIKTSFLFLVINGFLLLGLSKILWIEGIHRISVTKSTALNAIAPILTIIFAWLLLAQLPTGWQLLSIIPMFGGIILLGLPIKKHS